MMLVKRWMMPTTLALLALVVGGAVLWRVIASGGETQLMTGVRFDTNAPIDDFTLVDDSGASRSLSSLRGKYVVLFFGYTNCPDVCPATLAELAKTMPLLGEKAERLQVVLVSIDPDYDTPERLHRYVTAFDPRFMGLTGDGETIERLATKLGIYCEALEPVATPLVSAVVPPTQYDHTASLLVIDPKGHLVALFPGSTRAEPLAADLAALLR